MFEIVICDDDSACLEQTCQLVNDWKSAISTPIIVKTMESGDKLLEYCAKNRPDVILLDIMMPLLNGMDAARELREHNLISKIIFLTTSPVDREKLYKLLDKCLSAVSKPADSIAIHTAFGYQNVLMHHIEFIEAQNKKVKLALYDGQRLEAIGTLSYYEKLLTVEKGFFKCHRSYIVYMPAVEHFSATELVTKSGTKISISRGLSKSFQDAYFSYMFKE